MLSTSTTETAISRKQTPGQRQVLHDYEEASTVTEEPVVAAILALAMSIDRGADSVASQIEEFDQTINRIAEE